MFFKTLLFLFYISNLLLRLMILKYRNKEFVDRNVFYILFNFLPQQRPRCETHSCYGCLSRAWIYNSNVWFKSFVIWCIMGTDTN